MDSKSSSIKKLSPEADMKKLVGVGGYGKVYATQHSNIVMKIVPNHEKGVLNHSVTREACFLRMLQGTKHVLQMNKYTAFDSCSRTSLVMYPGSLTQQITLQRTTQSLYRVILSILEGVNNIQSTGIIHGDLKPDNILFRTEDDIAISDFGLSVLTFPENEQENTPFLQTLKFRAPEIITEHIRRKVIVDRLKIEKKDAAGAAEVRKLKNSLYSYSGKVDMWSVGVILYMLVTKNINLPISYKSGTDQSMDKQVLDQLLLLFSPGVINNLITPAHFGGNELMCVEFKKLLNGLLSVDVFNRLSSGEALNSRFVALISGKNYSSYSRPATSWMTNYSERKLPYIFPTTELLDAKAKEIPTGVVDLHPSPENTQQVMENFWFHVLLCNNRGGNIQDLFSVVHAISSSIFFLAGNKPPVMTAKQLEIYNIFQGDFFYPVIGMYILDEFSVGNPSTSKRSAKEWLAPFTGSKQYKYKAHLLRSAFLDVTNERDLKNRNNEEGYLEIYHYVKDLLQIAPETSVFW